MNNQAKYNGSNRNDKSRMFLKLLHDVPINVVPIP